MYGLLTKGDFRFGKKIYRVEINLGHEKDTSDFYTYHEDSWIRRLLQETGIFLKQLLPGTYLRTDEKWMITFSIQSGILVWSAKSAITGQRWKDRDFIIKLNTTYNNQQAVKSIVEQIEELVPLEDILNLDGLTDKISNSLRRYGYGDESPECMLEASRDGRTCRIRLIQVEGVERVVLNDSRIEIDKRVHRESIIEAIEYEVYEGETSQHNITNRDQFVEEIQHMLSENVD